MTFQTQRDALLNQALALIQKEGFAEAYSILDEAVQNFPDHVLLGLVALTAIKIGKWGRAGEYLRRALKLTPGDPMLRASFAHVLNKLKFFKEAKEEARKAIEINPHQYDAYAELGHAMLELGHVEESVWYLEKSYKELPDCADTLSCLGKAYTALFRVEKGEGFCREALRKSPANADAYTNLGMSLRYQGRYTEAIECFQKAIQYSPEHPYAHLDLGVTHLLMGDYQKGWREYAYRLKTEGWRHDRFIRPAWDGMPFKGKKLLVHSEQGLGDTIQFLRFLPQVQQLGGMVILECQPELVRWAEKQPGHHELIPKGQKRPPYDLHAYLMSLPELLGSELETLPPAISVIGDASPPSSLLSTKIKVGIAWAGSPGHTDDKRRSTSLEYFLPLANLPDIELINLQKGHPSQEIFKHTQIIDGVKDCEDFLDTAKVIQGVDLVIAVDTSVAHMAATLGKPTWILLGFLPDWRWLLDRSDSPWYSSVRLFRQKAPLDWKEQLGNVEKALRDFKPVRLVQNL